MSRDNILFRKLDSTLDLILPSHGHNIYEYIASAIYGNYFHAVNVLFIAIVKACFVDHPEETDRYMHKNHKYCVLVISTVYLFICI